MSHISQIKMDFNPRPYNDNVAYCLQRIKEASQCFHKNSLSLSFSGGNGHRSKPEKIHDLIQLNYLENLSNEERKDLEGALSDKNKSFLSACGISLDGSLSKPSSFSRLGRAVNTFISERIEARAIFAERHVRPQVSETNREAPSDSIEFIKMAMLRYRRLDGVWLPKADKVEKIAKYIFHAHIHSMDDMDIEHLKQYLREDEKQLLASTGVNGFSDELQEESSRNGLSRKIRNFYQSRVENYFMNEEATERKLEEALQKAVQKERQEMPLFANS